MPHSKTPVFQPAESVAEADSHFARSPATSSDTAGLQLDLIDDSLDHLMGIWSEDEAAEFREATKDFDCLHGEFQEP